MTADVELLPLPDWMECLGEVSAAHIRDYARANVEAKDAQIEALRAEVGKLRKRDAEWNRTAGEAVAQAERLAEALRHLRNHTSVNSHQIELIDNALHPTAAQEGKESFWPKLPGSGGPDWTGHD